MQAFFEAVCGCDTQRKREVSILRRLLSKSRLGVVLVAVALIALAFPAAAFAHNYWGYNYISSTFPTGRCYYTTYPGFACDSSTSDSAQIDKAGGSADGYVENVYLNGSGDIFNAYTTDTISAFSSTGRDPAPGATCLYVSGGRSYIQCRDFSGFSARLREEPAHVP